MNRVGIGYDVHRFARGRRLVVGGVEIEHEFGLEGHSDADVLSHAIADALLGAAGLPDIGHFFPPSDERLRGMCSLEILRKVAGMVRDVGGRMVNVDSTVVAEGPRMGPHIPAMKLAIARSLGVKEAAVGIKATTNEGLGFLGRCEGVAALAVASVAFPEV